MDGYNRGTQFNVQRKTSLCRRPCPRDDEGRTAVLAVFLPLAVEAAAPAAHGIAPAAPLKQAAVQLVTRLAGAAAGPFRAAVGALEPRSKARLQAAMTPTAPAAALAAAAAKVGGGGGGLATSPTIRPPSIALKSNFSGGGT